MNEEFWYGVAAAHVPTVLWLAAKVAVEWFAAAAEADGKQTAGDLFWPRLRGILAAGNPFKRKER